MRSQKNLIYAFFKSSAEFYLSNKCLNKAILKNHLYILMEPFICFND